MLLEIVVRLHEAFFGLLDVFRVRSIRVRVSESVQMLWLCKQVAELVMGQGQSISIVKSFESIDCFFELVNCSFQLLFIVFILVSIVR